MGPAGRLDSWKAIAAYLKRDERTVRRWEKEGLPIHRHLHAKKASVYAYPSEIDSWWDAGPARLAVEAVAPSRRRLAWLLAICSMLLAAGAGWIAFGDRLSGRPAAGAITSIAVLPLANLSGDAQQDYFVDGMTEALITELGRISALRVMSRSSVMAYKEGKKPVAQVARELNAEAVLEGAVVREGSRVRITVQLMRFGPERQLWTDQYERDVSSILVLQRDLARVIAAEIRAKLTPSEHAVLATARAVNPEAYERYLTGRYHWNKASAQGLLKARESFEEAIRKDPGFAPAYAGLADTYAWSYRWLVVSMAPPQETFSKARAAALKALELDDTLAEAHAVLAYIKESYDWDWAGAEDQYRRAIELNPNHAGVRHLYAMYLAIPRRFDEAFVQLRRAEQLDPHSRPIKRAIGRLYYWAGDFDRAIEQWQRTLELEPDFPQTHRSLGVAYTQKGMYAEAISAHRKGIALTGETPRSLAGLAHAYGKAGLRSEALKLLARLNELAKDEYVSGYDMAIAYMGLTNYEEALRWLETAFEARDQELPSVTRNPFWWVPLRADPRFQDLLRRLRLPA
jgi:TolB-like protein/tetratricopeptide (TPR) repeat protein